jgi:hypothetical protein
VVPWSTPLLDSTASPSGQHCVVFCNDCFGYTLHTHNSAQWCSVLPLHGSQIQAHQVSSVLFVVTSVLAADPTLHSSVQWLNSKPVRSSPGINSLPFTPKHSCRFVAVCALLYRSECAALMCLCTVVFAGNFVLLGCIVTQRRLANRPGNLIC